MFGRKLFDCDGVRPTVLLFLRISPFKTGVLPFRLVRLFSTRLLGGRVGPTFGQLELLELLTLSNISIDKFPRRIFWISKCLLQSVTLPIWIVFTWPSFRRGFDFIFHFFPFFFFSHFILFNFSFERFHKVKCMIPPVDISESIVNWSRNQILWKIKDLSSMIECDCDKIFFLKFYANICCNSF